MVFPKLYNPISVFWLGLSKLLGKLVSKLILMLVFFIIVTPIEIIRKLIGIDSLKLKKFKQGNESVMNIREITFSPKNMDKPF